MTAFSGTSGAIIQPDRVALRTKPPFDAGWDENCPIGAGSADYAIPLRCNSIAELEIPNHICEAPTETRSELTMRSNPGIKKRSAEGNQPAQ